MNIDILKDIYNKAVKAELEDQLNQSLDTSLISEDPFNMSFDTRVEHCSKNIDEEIKTINLDGELMLMIGEQDMRTLEN